MVIRSPTSKFLAGFLFASPLDWRSILFTGDWCMPYKLTVNGQSKTVDVPPDMPLLWVLRDVLNMKGTKFGCGIGQCGACTVHIGGQARSGWQTPHSAGQPPAMYIQRLFPHRAHPPP